MSSVVGRFAADYHANASRQLELAGGERAEAGRCTVSDGGA